MDIMTIKCFVAVARSLNFTKAAQECHISQTAMSKKISSLENELGVSLFYRNNRQVELTPAGCEFLSRANTLLEAYSAAVLHTQNIASGFESSLKIGMGTYEHALLHNIMGKYVSACPKTDVVCYQFSYQSLAEHLNDRLIDIMVSTDQYLYLVPTANYVIVHDAPWKFICSSENPLAQRETVSLKDLSSQNFITMNDGSHEQILRAYVPFGFSPRRFFRVNSYNTKVLMVRANLGVATLPSFMVPYLSPGVSVLEIDEIYKPRRFVAAWLNDNSNPALQGFIDMLLEAKA